MKKSLAFITRVSYAIKEHKNCWLCCFIWW